MPTWVRVCRCAEASSYSSRLLPNFGQEKTLMSRSLPALACFTAAGARGSGTQRRWTLAGRVPISRKWMTCNGCALKMNPREFSAADIPSSFARETMKGAIIRFLYSLFDPQRLSGQFTDWYQRAPAQFTVERRFTAVCAVAQHTDMKVVVNRIRFGATDAQIMNKLVEYRRQLLGLSSAVLSAAKRVFHRF